MPMGISLDRWQDWHYNNSAFSSPKDNRWAVENDGILRRSMKRPEAWRTSVLDSMMS
jgi:hypothetical protein